MNLHTRTALIDLAEHSVRSQGFDRFSYADLTEAIGIRKASIHYHFPTKANLSRP
jgi:TetR/AcrR family transcriptional regulator, transcriptional repressor for nem operon